MKRLLGQALVVTAVGMGAVALTPSCADNDQSIFVNFVFAPPQNRQNGVCLYQADPTQPKWSSGVLDVGLSSTYTATLLVGSQLIARGDLNRAEPNRVHINGASVRVTDANGGAIAEFSTLGSGILDPEQNNIADYGVVSLPVIDQATAAKVGAGLARRTGQKQVIANIKVFGNTLGGVDLESGEFQFPISVCNGCLVTFPAGSDDPAVGGVDCKGAPSTSGAAAVLPCFFGQDEYVSCQQCQGFPVCDPATL